LKSLFSTQRHFPLPDYINTGIGNDLMRGSDIIAHPPPESIGLPLNYFGIESLTGLNGG